MTKMTIISPQSFNYWESVVLFMIVILGGSGSIPGVILGAFLVAGLPELFRSFDNARQLVFGLALMIMMIVRPQRLYFLILIDESHRWVNTRMPDILDLLIKYLREARKYFAGITFASQSVRDFAPEGTESPNVNLIKTLFELTRSEERR